MIYEYFNLPEHPSSLLCIFAYTYLPLVHAGRRHTVLSISYKPSRSFRHTKFRIVVAAMFPIELFFFSNMQETLVDAYLY
jgi:hypothetical protein